MWYFGGGVRVLLRRRYCGLDRLCHGRAATAMGELPLAYYHGRAAMGVVVVAALHQRWW